DHEQRPFVADDVERRGDGAVRAGDVGVPVGSHGAQVAIVTCKLQVTVLASSHLQIASNWRTLMSATMSSTPLQPSRGAPAPLVIVVGAWFAAVFALGASGAFMAPPRSPPLALLIAFVAPIASAVIAYRISPRFREWVLGIEPRLLVALNAWRWAGFSFV